MISHHQWPFEVCQPVLSPRATLQICFWSFNQNVTRDQVHSLMNACLAWFIWHWPEERTYLAYCLLPSLSLEERLPGSKCFLSSLLYLLAASGGKLGCYHQRSSEAKASCQARVCGCGEVRKNGWTTLPSKAAVVWLVPAIPMHFMLHQQTGRPVFVRRLWARVYMQKEECSDMKREEWLWLQTTKT